LWSLWHDMLNFGVLLRFCGLSLYIIFYSYTVMYCSWNLTEKTNPYFLWYLNSSTFNFSTVERRHKWCSSHMQNNSKHTCKMCHKLCMHHIHALFLYITFSSFTVFFPQSFNFKCITRVTFLKVIRLSF